MPSGHARNAQICPNLGFGGFPETPNLPKFGHFFDSVYHYVITNLPKFDISGFPGFRRETPNLPKFGVSGPVREGLPRPIPGMPGKAFPDPSRACPEWVREAPSRTCPGRSGRCHSGPIPGMPGMGPGGVDLGHPWEAQIWASRDVPNWASRDAQFGGAWTGSGCYSIYINRGWGGSGADRGPIPPSGGGSKPS